MKDSMIYILLWISIISLIVAITSLVLVINILKKQKEIKELCTKKQTELSADARVLSHKENVVQNIDSNKQKPGIIICRRCYAAIPETGTVCAVCKTPVGRR